MVETVGEGMGRRMGMRVGLIELVVMVTDYTAAGWFAVWWW